MLEFVDVFDQTLDVGDTVYHKVDKHTILTLTEQVEHGFNYVSTEGIKGFIGNFSLAKHFIKKV